MSSAFTWIDYSESARRRMLDTISLFREAGTVDDLGLGTVRDTFADLLFPGTSTIQTRARYFLLIPFIYLELERGKILSREAAQWARKKEVRLIDVLIKSGQKEGVFGIEARDSLRRLPSHVYWQGLAVWGIRVFQGSQEQYHRSLDRFYARTAGRAARREEGFEQLDRTSINWHPGLPSVPRDLWDTTTLVLTQEEAGYLRERIMARTPGSLLAFLVDQGTMAERTAYPWSHPDYGVFPKKNRVELEHAHNFSLVMYGAALLYNLMLAEKQRDNEGQPKLAKDYEAALDHWTSEMDERQPMLCRWERDKFWGIVTNKNPRITVPTRKFIDAWLDIALEDHRAVRIKGSPQTRQLIERREKMTKGPRARLQNPRALELWRGAAGAYRFEYRWHVAQTIVGDILAGLKG